MPLRSLAPTADPSVLRTHLQPARVVSLRPGAVLFREGEPADRLYFIESGSVKLSRLSEVGREAIVALLTAGDFLGENCLIGQQVRLASAQCIVESRLWEIERSAVLERLGLDRELSEILLAYALSRNARYQDDLADQLFNSTEKRLARTLLLLARLDATSEAERSVPALSHEELAELVGATRARITYFMNRFRRLGFLDYDRRHLRVRSQLVKVLLRD